MTTSPLSLGAFLAFARTAEQIRATAKRLEKAALLGDYLGPLSDDDLGWAVRYFAGHTFPLRDQRTINIGGAALLAALLTVTGADERWVRERLVARGDLGDVAQEAWATWDAAPQMPSLTLADVSDALETLAGTPGTKRKTEQVAGLLTRSTAVEAKYLVKLLAGDLRIGLKEGAVEDAVARLAAVPIGQVQRANMLEGDIGRTALLARRGRLDDARMRLFHPLKFMLATPAADLADVARQMPSPFVVEDKYDGIRAQAHVAHHAEGDDSLHGTLFGRRRVALFSRTLDEITGSFPELIEPLAALLPTDGDGLILDGEIVPVRGETIRPFQDLQQRLGRKAPTPDVQSQYPVAFIAYDLLYSEGTPRWDEALAERRRRLESLPFGNRVARLTPTRLFADVAALDDEFAAARARGNEGLMVKDPSSPYKPGRRGRDWLKIKRALATLDVVITAAQVGDGRRARFLSDFTFAVRASDTDPTLLNVGKAYSGLTDVETQELSDWCLAHTLQEFAHGKVRTVEPRIVLEVTFDRVQPSARHKSGYALRFPRILRLRPDKPAFEIDTLDTVRLLVERSRED